MHDLFQPPTLPGYRLHKLEVMNWGTFDSTDGTIHKIEPTGKTSLLIGLNGSGKSTLVDALLTLLVPAQIRRYNEAAGSTGKRGARTPESYFLGAYDHGSQEAENTAKTLYLRPDGRHSSVLLAYFRNEDLDQGVTIAQFFYLNANRKTEKIFCFAQGERSIAGDFGGLQAIDKVRKQLKARGFKVTGTFKEYQGWLSRAAKMRSRAMDVFNQTVSVKDIRSLNDFIRSHMLEPPRWRDGRIQEVLTHFDKLSGAHDLVVKARKQLKALEPVAQFGEQYLELRENLNEREMLLQASDLFFRNQVVEVLTEKRENWEEELAGANNRLVILRRQKGDAEEQIRKLRNDIENAGGARLRELPGLIEKHSIALESRKREEGRYFAALRQAEIDRRVEGEEAFVAMRQELTEQVRVLAAGADKAADDRATKARDRKDLEAENEELAREIASLQARPYNLPGFAVELRESLCQNLHIEPARLPFVAELIAVKPEQREWESAVEMVLRNFGLSMLVPADQYRAVSRYVNQTRLRDERGRGQKLVYHRIGEESSWELAKKDPSVRSVWHKLDFKEDHPLVSWVQSEIARRFDILCCETLEDFQNAQPPALTAQRQLKFKGDRHEKDDRSKVADPRNYVLGWDNQAKLNLLRQDYKDRANQLAELSTVISRIGEKERQLRTRYHGVSDALKVEAFADIDTAKDEAAIAALTEEKERLEKSDDVVSSLKEQLALAKETKVKHETEEVEKIKQVSTLENKIEDASRHIQRAETQILAAKEDGSFAEAEPHFEALQLQLRESGKFPFDEFTVLTSEVGYQKQANAEISQLRHDIEPIEQKVNAAMNHFLRDFPDFETELQAASTFVDDFLQVRERLQEEDLPRYEKRFRDYFTENVVAEIGHFDTQLRNEASEIADRIEHLNQYLGQIPYGTNPDTVLKLLPRDTRDAEIVDFRAQLRGYLSNTYEGTPEAFEAAFERTEKMIARLRDEPRWREKVTDVRRWYDFAVRVFDPETDDEHGYYTDSQGQSGGEKAKLAFTILVAAVVYQFDIDPDASSSGRFHFVVVDEMFSKVDDRYATYAMQLFEKFGLQLLIVAPFDAKAKVTEPFVEQYLLVTKRENRSQVITMTAKQFREREALVQA